MCIITDTPLSVDDFIELDIAEPRLDSDRESRSSHDNK